MTSEEYRDLQHGDEIMLVDDIEEVAGYEWDHLVSGTYTKDTIYLVDKNETNNRPVDDGWVAIQKTDSGKVGHGWPYVRWQLVNSISSQNNINDMYKLFGMEIQDD